MNKVELVSCDVYQSFQFEGLVSDYRKLIAVGLDTHIFLDAARIKWGCTWEDAQLAIREADEIDA